ncbi:MerR family transcriptional regulator [Bacillus thermotolerans]|uniref:Transcriptional activator tipA n=1 Tax=Bacillus thermotolerans TaxID=1221996 RepID=A0A0F5HYK9_BACTR|nr:MerR family transcriptional regulator [Bacillus thermotolerans]KKB38308.1 transcriptional activator tipA [Bacillus thermotolerans]KKB39855.1 transcriptional activator tipA [Bacillus thermotolerans]
MAIKIKEAAELAGISIRTLHHYDHIGLLSPTHSTESGYRLYTDKDMETLQQILFFKELGFSLKRIKEIINSPSFDRREALQLHRKRLLEKRDQLDQMIVTVEKTIQHMEGEIHMSNKEKFEGFRFDEFKKDPYEQEARERWGDQAVDESKAKVYKMSPQEQRNFTENMNEIYRALADLRHTSPASEESQKAIEEWYRFLNKMGSYSLDAFKGLGQMYVQDERFTKNIDQFGEGLAQFMCEAMAIYADNKKKRK